MWCGMWTDIWDRLSKTYLYYLPIACRVRWDVWEIRGAWGITRRLLGILSSCFREECISHFDLHLSLQRFNQARSGTRIVKRERQIDMSVMRSPNVTTYSGRDALTTSQAHPFNSIPETRTERGSSPRLRRLTRVKRPKEWTMRNITQLTPLPADNPRPLRRPIPNTQNPKWTSQAVTHLVNSWRRNRSFPNS